MVVNFSWQCLILTILPFFCWNFSPIWANPQPNDIPEEVLRTEIIVEGRSPIDNQPLSTSEYAELQQRQRESPYPPTIHPELQQKIFLLRILKFIRTITP